MLTIITSLLAQLSKRAPVAIVQALKPYVH